VRFPFREEDVTSAELLRVNIRPLIPEGGFPLALMAEGKDGFFMEVSWLTKMLGSSLLRSSFSSSFDGGLGLRRLWSSSSVRLTRVI